MGENHSDNTDQNSGSYHNLGQYLCKRKALYQNHLRRIRPPMIHSDPKLKDCLSIEKKKKIRYTRSSSQRSVCGLSMFDFELP